MKCVHHWECETTSAPQARGVCKKCGEVRLFDNGAHGLSQQDLNSMAFSPKTLLPDYHALGLAQHDRGSRIR